jgi:hypothetical protein
MISPVLIAAMLSTLPSTQSQNQIIVHEWGVVAYSGDSVEAKGSSGGPWGTWDVVVALAPVLYFYGPDFTADVTVCSLGEIFSVYPEPDQEGGPASYLGGLGSAIRWEGISARQRGSFRYPFVITTGNALIPEFDWALDSWRLPPSLALGRDRDGFADSFLYYEVDLSGIRFPLTLGSFTPEGTPEEERVSGEILLFHRLADGSVSCAVLPCDSLDEYGEGNPPSLESYSCESTTEVIRGWAEGVLTSEEVDAMWCTWEPYILYGDWEGEYLALFSLPQALIERVSTILVTPDSGLPVSYSRFFLGIKTQ